MQFKLPHKFERDTRWLYVKGGVEYGPLTASELLKAMDDHIVAGDTPLCELQSGRRGNLSEIKVFAEYLAIVAKQDELKKADEEFEASTRKMASHNRPLIIGFSVGIPLVIGGIVAALFWPDPKKDLDERPQAIVVPTNVDPTFAKSGSISSGPMVALDTDVVERAIQPSEGELDDYLKQKLKNENQLATAGQVDLAKRKKVAEEAADPKKKIVRKKKGEGGTAGTEAGSDESVLDFSDEGVGVEAGSGSSKSTAQKRFDKTVGACARSAYKGADYQGSATVMASVRLNPDGRLDSLQIQLDPDGPLTDIRMCVVSELPNLQVPPYEGDTEKLYSSVKIAGQ